MPRRILNIGGIANDGKGDTLRVASQKINENFQELYTGLTFSENVGNLAPALINTDSLNEGLTNLYFSNERVDDRVNGLIVAGNNITKTYDDASNTLTISSTAGTDLNSFSVTTGAASGSGSLSYNNSNGVFTFAPADISLSGLSVNTASPSLGGSLTYSNTTGVFTFTPPDLSSYLTSFTETDTLDTVLNRGATSSVGITVGSLNGHTIPAGSGTLALTSQLGSGGGLTDIEFDVTPQLGGDLDVNGNNITGSTVNIVSTNAGNINITPDTSGNVVIDGATWPNTGIVNGYVLQTDGSGNLSWVAQSGGNTALATQSSDGLMSAGDKTKLDGLSSTVAVDIDATFPQSPADGELFFYEGATSGDPARLYIYDTNVWVDAAPGNLYTHPNHTGEVTSTGDGATEIADNVVDEANLKVSNSPVNGYVLTAQSGNTGGLTWAEAAGGGLGASSPAANQVLNGSGTVGAGLYYFRTTGSLSVTGATVSGQAWGMQDTGGGGQDTLLTDVVSSAGDGLSISGGNTNSIAGSITGWVRSSGNITFGSATVWEVE